MKNAIKSNMALKMISVLALGCFAATSVISPSYAMSSQNDKLIPRLITGNIVSDKTDLLSGKYRVLSEPNFDGEIVYFKANNTETQQDEEIQIKAQKLDQNDIENLLRELSNSAYNLKNAGELIVDAIEWFENQYNGLVVLIDKSNPYGVHGITCKNGMYISDRNPIELFRQILLAMSYEGKISLSNVLSNVKDKTWYESKTIKLDRKGSDLHYAIRALTREVFSEYDSEFSNRIKNRLTVSYIIKAANNAKVKYAQVLLIFKQRRPSVNTRAQEIRLLTDIIEEQKSIKLQEAARAEEKARQERECEDSERRERQQADEILKKTKDAINNTLLSYEERQNQAIETIKELNKLNNQMVADKLADLLIEGSVMHWFEANAFHAFLINSGILVQPIGVIDVIISNLYKKMASVYCTLSEKKKIFVTLNSLFLISRQDQYEMQPLPQFEKDLFADFSVEFKDRVSVAKYMVDDVTDYQKYFDSDPSYPDILYFKKKYYEIINNIRDLTLRKRLIRYYETESFRRSRIQEIYESLIKKERIFNDLLNNLQDASIDNSVRMAIIEILSAGWSKDTPADKLGIFIKNIIDIYERSDNTEDREQLMLYLWRLRLLIPGLEEQKTVVEFIKKHTDSLANDITSSTSELAHADLRYEQVNASESGYPPDDKKAVRRQVWDAQNRQESFMKEMEKRLEILSELSKSAVDSENPDQAEFGNGILDYIMQIAKNDTWDLNTTAEILSNMSEFIQRGKKAVIFPILNRIEADIGGKNDTFEKALSGNPPDEQIKELLKDKSIIENEKLAYLLIMRHSDRSSLLRDIINDAAFDIRLRICSFTWYAAKYLKSEAKDAGGDVTTTYNENEFNNMVSALGDDAQKFTASLLKDNEAMTNLVDNIWLQDEQAKVYVMAVYLTMQKNIPLSRAKGFTGVAELISKTRVRGYWENANASFVLGGRLLRRTSQKSAVFLGMIAHELMHDILLKEYSYNISGLKAGTIHELLADMHNFALCSIFGIDQAHFMDALGYGAHFEEVQNDDYQSIEVHEGARAQFKLLQDIFLSQGLNLFSTEVLKRILETAAAVLSDPKNSVSDQDLSDTVKIILEKALLGKERPGEIETMAVSADAKATYVYNAKKDFFGRDNGDLNLKTGILRPDQIAEVVKNIPSAILPMLQRAEVDKPVSIDEGI